MKSSHWGLVLLAVGLVVGFLVGAGAMDRNAHAQGVPIGPPPQRFQISAWGVPGSAGSPPQHGCYIVDIVTGEMWHVAQDGSGGIPKKIGQKLQ